jgi:hypothetical protein
MVVRTVLVASLMGWAVGACRAEPATKGAAADDGARDFKVFEWTPYHQRLLAPGTGIRPIWLVQDGFWARGADGGWDKSKPDERATRATAWLLARKGMPVAIDIEHWPVDIRRADEATVRQSLRKLAQVADWIHAERPGVKLGFYGVLPIQDYWTPVKYERAKREGRPAGRVTREDRDLERWRKANALVAEYLKDRVDYVFPSLYTFYDDPAGWAAYAKANLAEARKFGKPVYPFLWMEYHDSNAELKGRELPREAWRAELEFCRRHADGAVIWGGGKTTPDGRYVIPPWNEASGWWQETLGFMAGLRAGGG